MNKQMGLIVFLIILIKLIVCLAIGMAISFLVAITLSGIYPFIPSVYWAVALIITIVLMVIQ